MRRRPRVAFARRWAGLLTLILLSACMPEAGPGRAVRAELASDGQVIALVPDDATRLALLRASDAAGYRLRDTSDLPSLGLIMLTFDLPEGVTGPQAIQDLEAAEPASVVGVNHAYTLQQGVGGADAFDYADQLVHWPSDGCRALAPAGLIDTAVDPGAPGLAGVRVIGRRFVTGGEAPTRHGTEVATVLADPRRLRDVTLYSAAVVGDTLAGEAAGVDTLIRALDWMAGEGVRVVNVSLAGPFNKLLERAVGQAASRGLTIVAAVGNDGPDADPRYPAAYPQVIAVTAVDADRRIYRDAVRGPQVDIAAPGVDVFVSSGTTGRFVTGTSIAAPFVSARILADQSLLAAPDAEALRRAIAATAEDLGGPGPDPEFGAGLLRAETACGVV